MNCQLIPRWAQINFQDRVTSVGEEFLFFHDFANLILLFIITTVLVFIIKLIRNKLTNKNLIQGHLLELIWTIVPGLILVQLALPSLILLYSLEEDRRNSAITIKVVGHQWYWAYSFPELISESLAFDSYIIKTPDLEKSGFRLLETDNIITLPYFLPTRVLVTSSDVLHSWTIPSLGIKADAVPGRLNQLLFNSYVPGIYFGQCSEICGANHSFIPIIIQLIKFSDWVKTLWLENMKTSNFQKAWSHRSSILGSTHVWLLTPLR